MKFLRVCLRNMVPRGSGAVWSMEGLGSEGRVQEGVSVHSGSKAGVRMVSRVAALEAKSAGVIVGTIRPGIIATELIADEFYAENAFFLDAVAELPDEVAPWIVGKVLSANRTGKTIDRLSPQRIVSGLVKALWKRRDPYGKRS